MKFAVFLICGARPAPGACVASSFRIFVFSLHCLLRLAHSLRWDPAKGIQAEASSFNAISSVLAAVALVLAFGVTSSKPDDAAESPNQTEQHLWHEPFVKAFRGPHVPKKLSKITIREPFNWQQTDERIGVVAVGTKITELLSGAMTLEWEALYGDHWGTDDFHELGANIYARWNRFPWNQFLRTTFAVGMGPSITSKAAHYEPHNGTKSRVLLQLNFEINIYSPSKPQWALLFRIQHRSGVYKWINDVRGGSNFLTIGVRKNF